MQKIVINSCFGCFGLSEKANKLLKKATGKTEWDVSRDDPALVEIVEKLGEAANGFCAQLVIVEIPDGVAWEIDEYDGSERVDEAHRSWG